MTNNKHLDDHYLSDLFHYDPSQKKRAEIQKGLEEFQFLLLMALKTIDSIQNLDLEKFDPIIGENACQIRAIKMALLVSKNHIFDDLHQRITNSLAKIEKLLSPASMNKLMRGKHSLKEIIDLNNIDITLTSDEIFLIKSYILTEMKVSNSEAEFMPSILKKDRCVPDKLQECYSHISSTFLSKLAKKARKLLARSSVDFVKKAANELAEPSLIQMVSGFIFEHNSLPCTPTFWTFKTLFLLAQKEIIPIIIHVKFINEIENGYHVTNEEFLFYKSCETSKVYSQVEYSQIDSNQPVCIIEGVACHKEGHSYNWKDKMSNHSIIDILLAISADHRQYPDSNRTIPISIKEYDHYKNIAELNGFSMKNPTTFFAQHIYCSQLIRKMPMILANT